MPPVPPNFNQQGILSVFNMVDSYCSQLGWFSSVDRHEPKNAPPGSLNCSVWVQAIEPARRGSGLAATTGILTLNIRIYMPFMQQPWDDIDPQLLAATCDIMAALSGDFDFTGSGVDVRCVDLTGMYGAGHTLNAKTGYLEIDRKIFRVSTINCPIVINDMFKQVV